MRKNIESIINMILNERQFNNKYPFLDIKKKLIIIIHFEKLLLLLISKKFNHCIITLKTRFFHTILPYLLNPSETANYSINQAHHFQNVRNFTNYEISQRRRRPCSCMYLHTSWNFFSLDSAEVGGQRPRVAPHCTRETVNHAMISSGH